MHTSGERIRQLLEAHCVFIIKCCFNGHNNILFLTLLDLDENQLPFDFVCGIALKLLKSLYFLE